LFPVASGIDFNTRNPRVDWHYAQHEPNEQLAQLHHFTLKKVHEGREVEFQVTVKEFAVSPHGHHGRFFAQADKAVNQKSGPFIPSGWGDSLLKALSDCMRLIREFPYEAE
jgi:hypothetical protein